MALPRNESANVPERPPTIAALWEAGEYAEAELQLTSDLTEAIASGSEAQEAELRVWLALVLKYRNDFTRGRAHLERVLQMHGVPAAIMRRARTAWTSFDSELRRIDQMRAADAWNDVERLTHIASAQLQAGQRVAALRSLERVVELAQRDQNGIRELTTRVRIVMFKALAYMAPKALPMSERILRVALRELDRYEAGIRDVLGYEAGTVVGVVVDARAIVLEAGRRFSAAVEEYRRAIHVADRSGAPSERARTRQSLLVCLIHWAKFGGDLAPEYARTLVDDVFHFLIDVSTAGTLAEAARLAAIVDRAAGRSTGNRDYFRSAIAWLEQADRWLAAARARLYEPTIEGTDIARRAFAGVAPERHALALEILCNDLGTPDEAFIWVQRWKGRVLAEVVGAAPLTAPATVPRNLLEDEERALRDAARASSHLDADAAQRALETTWDRIAALPGTDEYIALRRGTPISVGEIQTLLATADRELSLHSRRVVLIEYAAIGGQLLAFGIRAGDPHVVIQRVPVHLTVLQRALKGVLRRPEKTLAAVLAQRSVTACVQPILDWAAPGDVVCIVPAGPLFALPFQAVPVTSGPLILRNPIFYAPSATTLRSCVHRRVPAQIQESAAVFSNPTGDLDNADHEATAVANILQVQPIRATNVTRDLILNALVTKTLLHYAGHGYFDGADPLSSALVLDGGRVTARDLFAQRPGRLRLVALSACATGQNAVRAGDELLGLTRGLLYAGAASILAPIWSVDDEATAVLMSAFYTRWLVRGESKVDALAGAQGDLIAMGYSDPSFWAAFTLVGDWY